MKGVTEGKVKWQYEIELEKIVLRRWHRVRKCSRTSARQIVADISKKAVSVEVRVQRVRKSRELWLSLPDIDGFTQDTQSLFYNAQEIFSQTNQKKVVILHKILLQSFGPVSSIEHELWDKLLKDNILLKLLFFFSQLRVSIHIHGLYFCLGI